VSLAEDVQPDSYRGCFWPVEDVYAGRSRQCGNGGSRSYGYMAFCHVHERKFLDTVMSQVEETPSSGDGL